MRQPELSLEVRCKRVRSICFPLWKTIWSGPPTLVEVPVNHEVRFPVGESECCEIRVSQCR